MAKLTDVRCDYTGGGIYVVTAKYGNVYFLSDLDLYGTYSIPAKEIEEEHGNDYDSFWKDPDEPLPTWEELLNAIRESYDSGDSTNMVISEVENILREYHPNLRIRIGEKCEPTSLDPHEERLSILNSFIEIFEDFLDEKGIVIPNDEKEQSPESACNIYGTDYGNLSGQIEALLIRLGYMEEEV